MPPPLPWPIRLLPAWICHWKALSTQALMNYPHPSSMPSHWTTLMMTVHLSFHLRLSLLSILLPYTFSKMSTKKSTPPKKVKHVPTQLRASSNSRDSTLALPLLQSDNTKKKPSVTHWRPFRTPPQNNQGKHRSLKSLHQLCDLIHLVSHCLHALQTVFDMMTYGPYTPRWLKLQWLHYLQFGWPSQ